MRVLLDENLPHRLRRAIVGHEISTVAYMGWSGVRNGDLIKMAEAEGFDVLLTADRNMSYQQNLDQRCIAIVTLSAQDWSVINPHLEKITGAVNAAFPKTFQFVECGEFHRC